MALGLTAQQTGQQVASLPDAPGQQSQTIPDAPKPQTPGLEGVAPGKGTTPASNGTAPVAADPFQREVGETLPASPKAGGDVHEDDGPVPDLPLTPIGGDALPRLVLRVNYVEVPFTVKDSKGRLVPGLTWRDVRVYENGLRQELRRFVVDPVPLSVALVFDQSLTFDVMTRVNNSLSALQGAFAPYDEVAVFTYNNGPKMQTDFTAGQSPRLEAVIERSKTTGRDPLYYAPGEALSQGIKINGDQQDHINPLTSQGPGSPQGVSHQQVPREVHTLNDAILAAATALSKTAKGRRRMIYVISDGREYGSQAKFSQVVKYLNTNKITIYGTLVGDSSLPVVGFLDRIHLPLMMRDNILAAYVKQTGGDLDGEFRQKGIETSFGKIAEEVRTQYTVGYYTHEPFIDGKYRTLEVKVLRPNLQVYAKPGYFPTASDVTPNVVNRAR